MTRSGSGEIVPLADRFRYMQWLRGALVAGVLLAGVLTQQPRLGLGHLLAASGVYVGLSLAGEALWRRWPGRGLYLFGGVLLADGVYLAGAAYATGGTTSTVGYLILLHLIAVTLLASYRTGLKLAMWHSLLLLTVRNLEEAGILAPLALATGPDASERHAAFMGALWVVAVVTAACSAGNERELRRRKVDLEGLAAMASRLESAVSPATVSTVLVDSVADNFGFGRVVLVGGVQGTDLLAERGAAAGHYGNGEPGSVVATASQHRETLLVDGLDATADPGLGALLPDARNLIVVPLVAEDRPIGALVAEHGLRRGSRVERRVVSTVERFVSHAALGLRKAWLLEEVRALAEVDQLTGIANRRVLDRALAAQISKAARQGGSFALLLVDIDRFKLLNDTHGHQTGDEVLHGVAQALQANCDPEDVLARYGGEEFAVIVPDCDATQAVASAERFRQAISHADVSVPVTASLGVALCPTHGSDPASLVSAADTALYASKEAGRDRVTLAPVVNLVVAGGVVG